MVDLTITEANIDYVTFMGHAITTSNMQVYLVNTGLQQG